MKLYTNCEKPKSKGDQNLIVIHSQIVKYL